MTLSTQNVFFAWETGPLTALGNLSIYLSIMDEADVDICATVHQFVQKTVRFQADCHFALLNILSIL